MQATPQVLTPFEVPEWMQSLGLKKGEWLNLSKAQLRSQQRPGKTLKAQVWATGMLHAAGYKGQEATTLRSGKRVPLTPGDIIKELWEVAKKYYADAGIQATEEELKDLKETKEHVRDVMKELEAEGVAMRTDLNGTPLRELSREQLKRLPSGKTRMYFWLVPKAADRERVQQQWRQRQLSAPIQDVFEDSNEEPENPEVAPGVLPLPPIRQILKALQIDEFRKDQITSPTYQKTIERAWAAARNIFIEVVATALPQVAPTAPPEVAPTAGALESKEETIEVVQPAPRPPSSERLERERPSSSSHTDDDAHRPDGDFQNSIVSLFIREGKPSPNPRQLTALLQAIPHHQDARAAFIPFLAEKVKRIKHPGALASVAEEFTAAWPEIKKREDTRRAEVDAVDRRHAAMLADEKTEAELNAHVETAWEQMLAADKADRLQAARQRLKTETRWRYISAEQKAQETELYARQALRRDLTEAAERMAS